MIERYRLPAAALALVAALLAACAAPTGGADVSSGGARVPQGAATQSDAAAAGNEEADADECGTIAGLTCPEGQVCEYPPGMCDVADLGGVCVDPPEVCPQVWKPVCACSGRTYSNDCMRLGAGAQKDHDGECEKDGS